jgi:hypothetical protein
MTVAQLISAAFNLARSLNPGLPEAWIRVSAKIGGLLPSSLLVVSVQRAGELDIVLRSMEDNFSPPQGEADVNLFSGHYQTMFSEIWIGDVYEIARLLRKRKLVGEDQDFTQLFHDLELLRIPLEKHEIAKDQKAVEKDPQRAHIMRREISSRGSLMWQVVDIRSGRQYSIERRELSERMIKIFDKGNAKVQT